MFANVIILNEGFDTIYYEYVVSLKLFVASVFIRSSFPWQKTPSIV